MKAPTLGWPTRVAAAVALAAWAYITTANSTIWRSFELSVPELNSHLEVANEPVADVHWPASAICNLDCILTANTTSWRSLELSVDDARRDAIRTEFAWSWHAVRHTGHEPRTSRPQTALLLTRARLALDSTSATPGRETSSSRSRRLEPTGCPAAWASRSSTISTRCG